MNLGEKSWIRQERHFEVLDYKIANFKSYNGLRLMLSFC